MLWTLILSSKTLIALSFKREIAAGHISNVSLISAVDSAQKTTVVTCKITVVSYKITLVT
jgi:hypothetical protein